MGICLNRLRARIRFLPYAFSGGSHSSRNVHVNNHFRSYLLVFFFSVYENGLWFSGVGGERAFARSSRALRPALLLECVQKPVFLAPVIAPGSAVSGGTTRAVALGKRRVGYPRGAPGPVKGSPP